MCDSPTIQAPSQICLVRTGGYAGLIEMNGVLQVFFIRQAFGMRGVEVQMQNLVTVVEILTMDVFLCQSQGEDARLRIVGAFVYRGVREIQLRWLMAARHSSPEIKARSQSQKSVMIASVMIASTEELQAPTVMKFRFQESLMQAPRQIIDCETPYAGSGLIIGVTCSVLEAGSL